MLGDEAGASADVEDLRIGGNLGGQDRGDLARGDVTPGGTEAFVIGLGPRAIETAGVVGAIDLIGFLKVIGCVGHWGNLRSWPQSLVAGHHRLMKAG